MEKAIQSGFNSPAMRSYLAWYRQKFGRSISPAEVVREAELRTAKKDLQNRRAALSKLTDIRCRRARLDKIAAKRQQ